MRITVDHSKVWLTLHPQDRGLFTSPFLMHTNWGEYMIMEILYRYNNTDFLTYRCEN